MDELIGKIVWCNGIDSHDLGTLAKRRPVAVIGRGEEFGANPDCLIAIAMTNTVIPAFLENYSALRGHTSQQFDPGFLDYGNCVAVPYTRKYFGGPRSIRDELLPDAFLKAREEVAKRCRFPRLDKIEAPFHAEMAVFPKPGFLAHYNDTAVQKAETPDHFRRGFFGAVYVLGYEGNPEFPSSVICSPFTWRRNRGQSNRRERSAANDVRDDVRNFLHIGIPSRGKGSFVGLAVGRVFSLPPSYLYFPANFSDVVRPVNPVYEEVLSRSDTYKVDRREVRAYEARHNPRRGPLLRLVGES